MAGQPTRVDNYVGTMPAVSQAAPVQSSQLRMLYASNAIWCNSGYGVQGRSLLPRLANMPQFGGRQNIANFAWYGLQGGMWNWDGFTIYPVGDDPYGNDVVRAHTQHFGANVVVSLIDVWVCQEWAKRVAPALWLPWLPIDAAPVPSRVLRSLEGAYMPLTYAKWGHDLLTKAGVENHYIPHGIETQVYKVLENQDMVKHFRQQFFGDTEHLTVMVAANKGYPPRKAFPEQLRAWAEFAKNKPKARLYIHTRAGQEHGGINFLQLVTSLGIREKVIFPDSYLSQIIGLPPEYLSLIYNNADAFLGASMSEGFGIPIIEAQACGAPVIVTDFSAMPELVRWGYTVPGEPYWTQLDSWQALPNVQAITQSLEELYGEWEAGGKAWPMERRQGISKLIHDEYDWDTIARDQWAPLVERLANDAPDLSGGKQWVVGAQEKPKVAALIIGIDGWEKYTAPLVHQIMNHEHDAKIVVIDNASREPYPNEPYVHRTDRLSYAAAINKAHSLAGDAEWYIVLSNDVECRGPFADMLAGCEPSVIGPYMATNMQFQYIEGWCVAIHKSVWQALRGWDEQYLCSSWEDVDFSTSARTNGFEVVEDKNLPFVHLDQKQRFGLPDYPGTELTNYNYYITKHYGAAVDAR